ncbi:MAG: class I SAM-dependent methyltransferase [Chloroflexota bacterium]
MNGRDRNRRDWDEIGRLDALWAILSDPTKRYGRWDVDEFLATGRLEIDALLETARRWRLPERRHRSLDFGCGVGRLTRALSAHFESATGVDISEVMVERARELNADLPACSFHVLAATGLAEFPDQTFDCIYSRIVLQHIPDPRVTEDNIRAFVRLLAVGGLLVFQLPARIPRRRRIQARPTLYALFRSFRIPEGFLYERLGLHPIRMRSIPESDVLRLLTAAGASVLDIERSVGDTGIEDRTYWVTRSR